MHHMQTSKGRTRSLMAGGLIATLAAASLIASTTQAAPGQDAAPTSGANKHVLDNNGHALADRTGGSDLATVKDFLRSKGANAATVNSLKAVGGSWTFRGVSHQRFEQHVSGLRVYGAEAKAAFNSQGELIHLIDFITPVQTGISPARKGTDAALRAAVKDLYPARSVSTTRARLSGSAAATRRDSKKSSRSGASVVSVKASSNWSTTSRSCARGGRARSTASRNRAACVLW